MNKIYDNLPDLSDFIGQAKATVPESIFFTLNFPFGTCTIVKEEKKNSDIYLVNDIVLARHLSVGKTSI